MNYNAMKELSDKLTSEMKNSQVTEESQIENQAGASDHDDTFKEETTVIPPSSSNESDQERPQEDRIADMLAQQQEMLNRLLGEVVAQTAQLTSLELQFNGLSSANSSAGDGVQPGMELKGVLAEPILLLNGKLLGVALVHAVQIDRAENQQGKKDDQQVTGDQTKEYLPGTEEILKFLQPFHEFTLLIWAVYVVGLCFLLGFIIPRCIRNGSVLVKRH